MRRKITSSRTIIDLYEFVGPFEHRLFILVIFVNPLGL
ncbi:unnamed protein product [Amoebophrya sp. A25]|nr:unnamed protein product [Amoebophrya sp. A25]|eukprot:GSA25T00021765001.1